ncbi:MAG: HAD family acid phosphatase [Vicinamibacterales bacterium]
MRLSLSFIWFCGIFGDNERMVHASSLSRHSLLWLVIVTLTGAPACRSTAPVTPATAPVPGTAPASALPQTEPDSVKWVRLAAEYHAAALQAYALATTRIEAAASRPRNTWAVVLDADETVISNLAYQRERALAGLPYTSESWAAWVARREATPIPGASRFMARVRDLGGRIAIVTNRSAAECDDTQAVFRQHALAYDAMLCRPEKGPSDKNPRFRAVGRGEPFGSGPVEVVLFVGDNILDFPEASQAWREQGESAFSEFGRRFVLVPNPMYGSWQ